jgi:acetyl esterase/lipase
MVGSAVAARCAAAVLACAAIAAAPRQIPGYVLPVPGDVSPELQALIGKPLNPIYDQVPSTDAGWRAQVRQAADKILATYPGMEKRLGVSVARITIGGVACFSLTPDVVPPENANRLLLHIHGGAYVLYPGMSAIGEAILMAGIGHFKVISVDYRMPPAYPYPAAMDDADAVWRALVASHKPAEMGVFGTSTGGAMTLLLVQRAMAEHLPLPAAIAPGTPWADLSKTGDTLTTNAFVDNVLVTDAGWLDAAAHLYAHGRDLKDPLLSPIYGDFHNFPPAILTSGTRDLFLSNTVRVQRKLRAAGVEAQLQVFEGMSHAQYQMDDRIPETRAAFGEIAGFFGKHLARD